MQEIIFKDEYGTIIDVTPIGKKHKYWKIMNTARENLLDQLSIYDDQLADMILENKEIKIDKIAGVIRKALLIDGKKVCVVLLGSALKNKGIQFLLDGILDYLPSPSEK